MAKEDKNQMLKNIDINDDFKKALDLIDNSGEHIFITGKAGTGKSTFLQYLRETTKNNIVVLAPTGVASVNIKGQTIHSFFNFKPDITVEKVPDIYVHPNQAKVYRKLDSIIIDEISMVRADLMDCVDAFLRIYGNDADKPFGGIQIVFIGDLYQLAPVVTIHEKSIFETFYRSPYFFDAKIFEKIDMRVLEFQINYRQDDEYFIDLLNHIRTKTAEQKHIDAFNERMKPEFLPDDDDFYVYLTTTNKLADKINYHKVHELNEELYTHEGKITGEFDLKNLPTQINLDMKVGAQVILLNNDSASRWINGSIGKIIDIFDAGYNSKAIQIELAGGERVEVEPFKWEIFHFYYDEDSDRIRSKVIGSFRQFPLKLAWALTIHKSQGKTFDRIIVDIGRGAFCHGQLYVALSRCRSLEGVILKRPISRRDVLMDPRVSEFMTEYQYKMTNKLFPIEDKKKQLNQAIENDQTVEIIYLKENNQRYARRIIPRFFRQVQYNGETCEGVEAFCVERQANWIFRLNCILEIKNIA